MRFYCASVALSPWTENSASEPTLADQDTLIHVTPSARSSRGRRATDPLSNCHRTNVCTPWSPRAGNPLQSHPGGVLAKRRRGGSRPPRLVDRTRPKNRHQTATLLLPQRSPQCPLRGGRPIDRRSADLSALWPTGPHTMVTDPSRAAAPARVLLRSRWILRCKQGHRETP